MTEPLTAGEPLGGRRVLRDAPNTAAPLPQPTPKPQPARRRPAPLRWLRRMVTTFGALFVLAAVAGLVVIAAGYQRFSADLPDLDTLRNYQPRVMSRLY